MTKLTKTFVDVALFSYRIRYAMPNQVCFVVVVVFVEVECCKRTRILVRSSQFILEFSFLLFIISPHSSGIYSATASSHMRLMKHKTQLNSMYICDTLCNDMEEHSQRRTVSAEC